MAPGNLLTAAAPWLIAAFAAQALRRLAIPLDATSPRTAFVIVGSAGLAGAAVTAILLRRCSRARAAGPGW